jgi:hypothetical protein
MTIEGKLDAIRASLRRLGNVELGPPLRDGDVRRFEARNRVVLPDGFRRFLLEIGNGGHGPGHGLQKLDCDAMVDDLSEPFPLTKPWVWDEDPDADEARIDACFHGWLELGTEGCGMDWALVVTGDERGRVWNVEGQGAQPCAPGRDFLHWYLLWLTWTESGGDASGTTWWATVWAAYEPG